MTVKELSRDQLIELKQNYYCSKHKSVSWGELAQIESLVSDKTIIKEYACYDFVDDDFMSSCDK